jgi:ABC-type multidrug transport system ATPase subunit
LLVADEPIAGLDPDAQLMVLDLIRRRRWRRPGRG